MRGVIVLMVWMAMRGSGGAPFDRVEDRIPAPNPHRDRGWMILPVPKSGQP
jgi:hypothetical protein